MKRRPDARIGSKAKANAAILMGRDSGRGSESSESEPDEMEGVNSAISLDVGEESVEVLGDEGVSLVVSESKPLVRLSEEVEREE